MHSGDLFHTHASHLGGLKKVFKCSAGILFKPLTVVVNVSEPIECAHGSPRNKKTHSLVSISTSKKGIIYSIYRSEYLKDMQMHITHWAAASSYNWTAAVTLG